MSLKTALIQNIFDSCNGNSNPNTQKTARAGAEKFCSWVAENREELPNRKELLTDPAKAQAAIQLYADNLVSQGYSPSTVHTYLYAPCRGLRVPLNDIDKPVRSAGSITRSRGSDKGRGDREALKEENSHLVNAQMMIGIRRAEAERLYGRDLKRDENGYLCVYVEKGKGGKSQMQRILPMYEERVTDLFKDKKADERIFSKEEMKNKIDLHGMRAEVARSAYDYYINRLSAEPNYRDQLRQELVDRWDHSRDFSTDRQRDNFCKEVFSDNLIYLRSSGDNYARAIEDDRPTVYDRTATLAVSVFHLSHWRTDVTITNYLV